MYGIETHHIGVTKGYSLMDEGITEFFVTLGAPTWIN
jgi:hypothetical protein